MASWIGTGASNPGDVKTSGNIGIGDDPSHPLDAVGRGRGDANGGGGFWLTTEASPTPNTSFVGRGVDDESMMGFWTGSWRLTVQDDGKVGIGTKFPDSGLHIDADAGGSQKGFITMEELGADASAPSSNKAALFVRDNGSGKTQLCVRFNTGAVQVLATQP